MTALTANRQTEQKEGLLQEYDCGVDIVYRGSLVTLNTSGYAVAGQDVAGYRFAGVAYEKKDNSAGSAGDVKVRCYRSGIYKFAGTGFAITDIGKRVYVADDQTVQLAQPGTGNVFCGVIAEYESATAVWVDIGPACAPCPANLVTLTGSLTAVTGTTAGGMLRLANPFNERAIITDVILDVTTKSTGAATVDVGVAANGTTSSDTLLDGVDVGSAALVANNIDNKGTNGGRGRAWASTEYITGTASATLAGLVGTYKVVCLVATARPN